MLKYILGLFINLFNKNVSVFAFIDNKSKLSRKAKINPLAKIYNSIIDSYSYVGGKTDIIFTKIGKFCSIADNCSIGIATHTIKNISTSPIFTEKKNGTGSSWSSTNSHKEIHPTIIGNDVWIGTRVIILGGVHIGDGAIIGAGSVVTKDIPDYAIAVGVPAKVKKYRFEKPIITKLIEMKWWNMSEEKIKNNIEIFQIENFSIDDLCKFE